MFRPFSPTITILLHTFDVTRHYCIFLCWIFSWIRPKKAEICRTFTTCLYNIVYNYNAVINIYIYNGNLKVLLIRSQSRKKKSPNKLLKQSTNIQFHFHPNTQSCCYLQSTFYKPHLKKYVNELNRTQCVISTRHSNYNRSANPYIQNNVSLK